MTIAESVVRGLTWQNGTHRNVVTGGLSDEGVPAVAARMIVSGRSKQRATVESVIAGPAAAHGGYAMTRSSEHIGFVGELAGADRLVGR